MSILALGLTAATIVLGLATIARGLRVLSSLTWRRKRRWKGEIVLHRWPLYEGGEMVECNGKVYVILRPSIRTVGRPAGGLGGPACYLVLNAFGVMESINNWETRRIQ